MGLIALGSNATSPNGPPFATLQAAVSALIDTNLEVTAVSRFFATPCVPSGAGPDYVNAAIAVRTPLTAPEVLEILHGIEANFDRERRNRWASRTLDLDLIALGDTVLPDAGTHAAWRAMPFERQKIETPQTLILPHPRVQDRSFVLMPLADIAPDWRHPILGTTVSEMLDALPDAEKQAISVLKGPLPFPQEGSR